MSGQSRSRDKSELVQRAKVGGELPGRLPVRPSGAIFQGSRVPSTGLAQPWGLLPLSSGPHAPSAPPATLTAAGT